MEAHQAFVVEALERFQDLPSKHPHDPRRAWISSEHSSAATTWFDNSYMDRLTSSDDPQIEYVRMIDEMITSYVPYSQAETPARDEPEDLPEWFGSAEHVASECLSFAHRIVKGGLGEILTRDHLVKNGAHIMSKEVAQRFAAFDGDIDEHHGIDLVAVWPNGDVETIQVKSSTGEASKYNGDADTILIADIESQEVHEY